MGKATLRQGIEWSSGLWAVSYYSFGAPSGQ